MEHHGIGTGENDKSAKLVTNAMLFLPDVLS
jgi:hypothetical protein